VSGCHLCDRHKFTYYSLIQTPILQHFTTPVHTPTCSSFYTPAASVPVTYLEYLWLIFAALTATSMSFRSLCCLLAQSVKACLWPWSSVVCWRVKWNQQCSECSTVQCDSRHDQHRTLPCIDRQKVLTQRRKHKAANTGSTHRNTSSKRSTTLKVVAHSNDVRQVQQTETDTCNHR